MIKKNPSPNSDTITKPFKPHHNHQFPKKSPKTPVKNHPDPNSTIITFPSSDLSAAKSLIDSLPASSLTPKSHNHLLQSFAATSPSYPDALSLLRHILALHPASSPDRSTYHTLLSLPCAASLSSIREILSLMKAEGFPPDNSTIDVAVRSLCAARRLEQAVKLVKEFPPDSYTYNFLLKRLCKDRDLATVYTFIEDINEKFKIKPDIISYTILIDNVCNRKNLREATFLMEILEENGLKLDIHVYNTIMKGHCMLDQGDELIRVFKKMKKQGVEPDLVTYNTLIFGLSKSGRVEYARQFLEKMAEEGHFPDAVTYTSLMNGMCRDRDALGAVELLREMKAKGCVPNSCTYNTLLLGLCKARIFDKAVAFFGVMREGGIKLESGSYGAYLRLLCKNGRVAEAYDVFDYAVESKSLKDVFAYSTLESVLKLLKKDNKDFLFNMVPE